jgi:hypothetical protein
VRLAISLHAATDELRNELVPLNKQYPIKPLMEAVRRSHPLPTLPHPHPHNCLFFVHYILGNTHRALHTTHYTLYTTHYTLLTTSPVTLAVV